MSRLETTFDSTTAWAEALVGSLREQPADVSEDDVAILQAQIAALHSAAPSPANAVPGRSLVAVLRKRATSTTAAARSLASVWRRGDRATTYRLGTASIRAGSCYPISLGWAKPPTFSAWTDYP